MRIFKKATGPRTDENTDVSPECEAESGADVENGEVKSIVKSATDIVFVAVAIIVIVGAAYFAKFGGPDLWRMPDEQKHTVAAGLETKVANKREAAMVEQRATAQRAVIEEKRASQAVWGQLGDYIGGILNPLLSFFALYLLMRNLQIQQVLIKQSEKTLLAVSAANEIASLAAALEVISEDLRQMQSIAGYSNHENYTRSLELKTWLAREIANRAQAIACSKGRMNSH